MKLQCVVRPVGTCEMGVRRYYCLFSIFFRPLKHSAKTKGCTKDLWKSKPKSISPTGIRLAREEMGKLMRTLPNPVVC